MAEPESLYHRIIRLVHRLQARGHFEHATKLRKALIALMDNLQDECKESPDYGPLLNRVSDLEQEGLVLLGEKP